MAIETTALLLRQRTKSIPIVMFISIDPVAAGLVDSLARPGGNVTGMLGHYDAIVVKRVEALPEIAPGARRIAYLGDPGWSDSLRRHSVMDSAARAKGPSWRRCRSPPTCTACIAPSKASSGAVRMGC
jgi:ABC-type uncharacterized transport system substrate-binding protein